MIRALLAAGAIGTIAWFSPMHADAPAERAKAVGDVWTQQRDAAALAASARLADAALRDPVLREAALREAARALQR